MHCLIGMSAQYELNLYTNIGVFIFHQLTTENNESHYLRSKLFVNLNSVLSMSSLMPFLVNRVASIF